MTQVRRPGHVLQGDSLLVSGDHCRQHFLNFFPLPQGHGSLGPSLGPSRRTVSCRGNAGSKSGSS
jgi:hypothetical protein